MKNSILSILFLTFVISVSAQSDIEKVKSTISKNKIEGHIYFLASDELKGRQTGSAENKIAAQYLANMLRSYGVKQIKDTNSYFQKVFLKKTSAATKTVFKTGALHLDKILTVASVNTDYKGKAIFLNHAQEDDYKNIDVTGKYVISIIGTKEDKDIRSAFSKTKEKMALAKEKGAIGFIEICNVDDATWSRMEHYYNGDKMDVAGKNEDSSTFSHTWINDQKEEISAAFDQKNEIDIEIIVEGIQKKDIISQNVVGYVEGSDPVLKNEYIIYSAHYDHVGIGKPIDNDSIYNGARDNAVGTVTVLSAAENIAKYPTKRSALFILFTGEEKGLLGSKWYVNHPVLPLHQMVYCFNSDNGGYNDTSIATIVGLGRTTAQKDIVDAATAFGLKAIDDPAPEQGLFDRSDNVHFAAKGIPAPTFSMGFTAFDEEITKYYHQVTDNPDTLDYEYLFKFFQSYVLACRNIANNPKTPFWIKGDKYYDAGKKLYQK
ncbi:M28 family metallopeptidase [Aquimarina muelleri]|uniref:Peptidase M28 n=1 Tax=Aquimarina muelleri TaxID=279356 RepID=A0A918N1X3_9FLAO|nr:M28 family peptidase [Aquimarina muelleri]MCX2763578.1 M28 family metallopeptidase [Aquimarina muelleri]GGX14534.1 peptidase M28 [Aquimarina muelleri]